MSKSGKQSDGLSILLAKGGPATGKAATGFEDRRFDLALRNINGAIGLSTPAGLRAPVVSPPAPAKVPAVDPGAAMALARRNWLMDVQEQQRALSGEAVPRLSGLSREDFLSRFYASGRPVVVEGALTDWPALEKWTPAYLRKTVGDAPVEFQSDRSGDPDFELLKDKHKVRAPFGRFMDLIEGQAGNDAYITAYNSGTNAEAFRPLESDMRFIDVYLTAGHGMLWVGPAGTFTPLHFDLTNNMLAQVVGRKQVILVPPSETPLMAHRRHVFSDVHDIEDERCLAKHPGARNARRHVVDLGPGDLLYIPIGWWHQVRSQAFSVMLTYTNFLWPNEGHATYPAG